jgi:hypothetical protein
MVKHKRSIDVDMDALLHPGQAFDTPGAVVNDPDLTLNEKRAILASWASDACAVDSNPALRRGRNGRAVTFDDIIDALRKLDIEHAKARVKPRGRLKRLLRERKGPLSGSGGVGLQ